MSKHVVPGLRPALAAPPEIRFAPAARGSSEGETDRSDGQFQVAVPLWDDIITQTDSQSRDVTNKTNQTKHFLTVC